MANFLKLIWIVKKVGLRITLEGKLLIQISDDFYLLKLWFYKQFLLDP